MTSRGSTQVDHHQFPGEALLHRRRVLGRRSLSFDIAHQRLPAYYLYGARTWGMSQSIVTGSFRIVRDAQNMRV